jgi:hypothetical protein
MMNPNRYVVMRQHGMDENILGYIIPAVPNTVQILHASVLRGSTCDRLQGSVPFPIGRPNDVRDATLDDFKAFRVMPPPASYAPHLYAKAGR